MRQVNQDPERRRMPIEEWPFADQAAWAAAQQPADFLSRAGVAVGWRASTRTMAVDGYGHWLTWLANTGQLNPSASAADRVTRSNAAAYAEALRDRLAPMTVAVRIAELGRMMRALAPDQDWGWLGRAAERLKSEAHSARDKRQRIQDVQVLLDLGVDLMRRADTTDPHFAIAGALLYRDGLMIALLALRPLRMRSFAGLRIEHHLVRDPDGWRLRLAAEDTKTGRPVEMPFPDVLVPFLERYLDRHRPTISIGRSKPGVVRPSTDFLWLSKGGRAMGYDAIRFQITRHTEAAFGQSVNPHLFRDCTATSIAIQDPEHVHVIAPLLGHMNLRMSEKYYNQAGGLEASRAYQKTMQQTRRALGTGRS